MTVAPSAPRRPPTAPATASSQSKRAKPIPTATPAAPTEAAMRRGTSPAVSTPTATPRPARSPIVYQLPIENTLVGRHVFATERHRKYNDPELFPSMPTDSPRLLFFSSARSGPSRRMESLLAHIARKERHRLRVVQVDVDKRSDVARRLGVGAAPTLVLI